MKMEKKRAEGFQMKPHHQDLLLSNRVYLLHNLRPTEELWASLLEKGVFSASMVEEIRSNGTTNQCVSQMLSLLPARGPDAFDLFCEVLLECDHQHVAECLMIQEGTDRFREDVQQCCSQATESRLNIEKIVDLFQKGIPRIKRFLERKFDLDIKEQDSIFNEKEAEVNEMEKEKTKAELRYKILLDFVDKVTQRFESLADEAQRDYVSRSFLREERKLLDAVLDGAQEKHFSSQANRLQGSFHRFIDYLDISSSTKVQQKGLDEPLNGYRTRFGTDKIPVTMRVQSICEYIHAFIEEISPVPDIDCVSVRKNLDTVLCKLNIIKDDMYYVRRVFISTLQKNEELKDETLYLIKNYQEIQRLEREMAEKRKHIAELRQQTQMVRKKSKKHQRQLDQIKQSIEDQKAAMAKAESDMKRQVASADDRIRFILQILPDEDGSSEVPPGRSTRASMLSSPDEAEWEGLIDRDETFLTSRAPSRSTPAAPRPMIQESTKSLNKQQKSNNEKSASHSKVTNGPIINVLPFPTQATVESPRRHSGSIVGLNRLRSSSIAEAVRNRSDSQNEMNRPSSKSPLSCNNTESPYSNSPTNRRPSLPVNGVCDLGTIKSVLAPLKDTGKSKNNTPRVEPKKTKPITSDQAKLKLNTPRADSKTSTPRTDRSNALNNKKLLEVKKPSSDIKPNSSNSRIPRGSSQLHARNVNNQASRMDTNRKRPPGKVNTPKNEPRSQGAGLLSEKNDVTPLTNGVRENVPDTTVPVTMAMGDANSDHSSAVVNIDTVDIKLDSASSKDGFVSDDGSDSSTKAVRAMITSTSHEATKDAMVTQTGSEATENIERSSVSAAINKPDTLGLVANTHKKKEVSLKPSPRPDTLPTAHGDKENSPTAELPEESILRSKDLALKSKSVSSPGADGPQSASGRAVNLAIETMAAFTMVKYAKPINPVGLPTSATPRGVQRLTSMPSEGERSAPPRQILTAKKAKLG